MKKDDQQEKLCCSFYFIYDLCVFQVLLTLDDDLIHTPRDRIQVFWAASLQVIGWDNGQCIPRHSQLHRVGVA